MAVCVPLVPTFPLCGRFFRWLMFDDMVGPGVDLPATAAPPRPATAASARAAVRARVRERIIPRAPRQGRGGSARDVEDIRVTGRSSGSLLEDLVLVSNKSLLGAVVAGCLVLSSCTGDEPADERKDPPLVAPGAPGEPNSTLS